MEAVVECAVATGVDQAIRMAGSQAKLAKSLGVSQQSVFKWQRQGFAPLEREISEKYAIERNRLVDPALVALLQEW